MKESPHIPLDENKGLTDKVHEILRDPECKENVQYIVWTSVVVLGMLALMLHGLAYLSSASVTGQDIYAREIMQKKILKLEEFMAGLYILYSEDKDIYLNHTHRYSDGKIKQETVR